jgi:LPXTG-motif cell wall-anchored protein
MRRSVRNGLAIAGMAGGMLFLGQAVASADTEAEGTIDQTTSAAAPSGHGDAKADSDIDQTVKAEQTTNNTVTTAPVKGGDGGNATAVANTGVAGTVVIAESGKHGDAEGSVDITTGDAEATANANGGNATSTNTINAGGAPTGHVSATGTVTSDTTATSGGGSGKHSGGGDAKADSDIDQTVKSEQTTNNTVDVGPVKGGDGGNATAVANTGVAGTVVICKAPHGDVYCPVTITTGDATATANANGGNATSTNTINVGTTAPAAKPEAHKPEAPKPAEHKPAEHKPAHHADAHHADCPDHHKAAAAAHRAAPVKKAAPAAHRAPASRTAQPSKGQLAHTGSDVSAPLTLGLLALGAGGALSLAGRRRENSTA